MLIVIASGAVWSYQMAVAFQTRTLPGRTESLLQKQFEARMSGLLRAAYLSPGDGAAPTYFVGISESQGGNRATSGLADTLTFTAAGLPISGAYMAAADDFQTLNERFGPQGGLDEISLSTIPVGEAGSTSGPYLRTQSPADGDWTQGGYEQALYTGVTSIGFEFYDGTAWIPEWDTSTMPEPRLPSAIRLTYTLEGEESSRAMIVRIPLSDVTPENPAGVGLGGAQ
jgi:hypothetical protein